MRVKIELLKKGSSEWVEVDEAPPSADREIGDTYRWTKEFSPEELDARRNRSVWFKLEDHPQKGYNTSVSYDQTPTGWIITDICVSMAWTQDDNSPVAPWTFDGLVTVGLNDKGITSRLLHDVRIGAINQEVIKHLAADSDSHWAMDELKKTLSPSRRQEHSPEFSAALAQAYVAAVKENPRRVHERIGREINYEASTVREYVKRLRVDGFLTAPPKRGAAGGELTDKAKAVLAAQEGSG